MVLNPLVLDEAVDFEFTNPVGTGPEWPVHCGFGEIPALPPVPGKDVQLSDDVRQLPVADHGEREPHYAAAFVARRFHVLVVLTERRKTVPLERVEREHHIGRFHGTPVLPSRSFPDPEGDPGIVRRVLDPFGQESVRG